MKRALLVMMITGLLVGCEREKGLDPALEDRARIVQLESEISDLQTERDGLTKILKDSEWNRDNHWARADKFEREVNQLNLRIAVLTQAALKHQDNEARSRKKIQELEVALARTIQAAAAPVPKPDGHPTPTVSPQSTARTDTWEEDRLTGAIEDLQRRITALRSEIARGQSKVSSLVRATVDVQMQPPPHGMIIPPGGSYGSYYGGADGLLLRRERVSTGTRTEGRRVYQDYYYQYVPCGAAIKRGDFRTSREKDAAIASAKKEVTPLHEGARELEKELERLKGDLAALRKEKK